MKTLKRTTSKAPRKGRKLSINSARLPDDHLTPPHTQVKKKVLKKKTPITPQPLKDEYDELPFYIIKTHNSVCGDRYLLIAKHHYACIAAQDNLEALFDSVTAMTDRNGHSLSGICEYIETAEQVTTYKIRPNDNTCREREQAFNHDYDRQLMQAIMKSTENKK